jgi:signal transduction histidine kinase
MIIRYSPRDDISYKKNLYRPHQSVQNNNSTLPNRIKYLTKAASDGQIQSGIISEANIIYYKKNENELVSLLKFAQNRNDSLESFVYIVSHNLRTHTNNLQSMLSLYKDSDRYEEKEEILSLINRISNKLNSTIEQLAEILKIEGADDDIESKKTSLNFETEFKSVMSALQSNITSSNAFIKYNFSNCQDIHYLQPYLESLFHNLLTNSIKYRDPGRQVLINCETKIENDYVYITFEDNGLGMDLERYGHKVFGLYQTFHQNSDSHGVGLYITRVQIESLGGAITVQSALNKGTKFIIKLSKI